MKKIILTSLIVSLFGFCSAKAALVTIGIAGTVTSTSGSGVPSTIYKDVTFTGTYTYNSLTEDSDTSSLRGVYQHDSPYGISIVVGGYEFKTPTSHVGQFDIQIANDDPVNGTHDYYLVRSQSPNISIPSDGFTINDMSWHLRDSTYDALSSDALPVTAPMLTDWDYNSLRIYGSNSLGGISIYGTVTQAAIIPEPATVVLMMIGMFLSKRRR